MPLAQEILGCSRKKSDYTPSSLYGFSFSELSSSVIATRDENGRVGTTVADFKTSALVGKDAIDTVITFGIPLPASQAPLPPALLIHSPNVVALAPARADLGVTPNLPGVEVHERHYQLERRNFFKPPLSLKWPTYRPLLGSDPRSAPIGPGEDNEETFRIVRSADRPLRISPRWSGEGVSPRETDSGMSPTWGLSAFPQDANFLVQRI